MPSKPLTLLIVLLIAASVWALSQEDWKRDVPYAPANSPLAGMMRSPGDVPAIVPPEVPGAPDGGTDPAGGSPDNPADPVKPSGEAGVDIMAGIDPIGFQSKHGVPMPKTGVVVIKIKKNRDMLCRGAKLGEPDMVADMARTHAGQKVIIFPDKEAPWHLVADSVDVLMKIKAPSVGLGYKMGGKPMMLDIALPQGPVAVPAGMDLMKLTVKAGEGGVTRYHLFEYDCENRKELISLVSDLNSDMAQSYDGNYSRDPAKTPWVVTAEAGIKAGEVLIVLAILRDSAVYTSRIEK